MEIPIPNDWNGDDWFCAQVEWPDSPYWIAILQGFLSAATRGRLWDGRSGSILAAQAIGREIWARNVPLIDCEGGGEHGDPPPPEIIYIIQGAIDAHEKDGCEMNCCIRWIDGVLSVWDCGAWVPVEGNGPNGEEGGGEPDEDWVDDIIESEENPFGFSACGKAWAITELIFAVANAVWEQADNLDGWAWIGDIESDTGVNLDNTWLINAVVQSKQMLLINTEPTGLVNYSPSVMFSQSVRTRMRNMLLGYVNGDTAEPMTREQVRDFRIAWRTSMLPDGVLSNFWGAILNAIHPGRYRTTTQAGAIDDTRDCDTELGYENIQIGPSYASDGGWYLGVPIAENVSDNTEQVQRARGTFELEQDLFGLVLRYEWVDGDKTVKPMSYSSVGSLPYDAGAQQLWGDTSGHFEDDGPARTYIFHDDAEIVIQLVSHFGISGAIQSTAGTWSSNPASPSTHHSVAEAETLAWEIRREANVAGDFGPLLVSVIYPIFNVNSPSHS